MSKAQQRKGRTGELELVEILNHHGIPAKPGKAVSCGRAPDITGVLGIHVEVKRVEKLNVSAAFAQAVRDSEKFKDGKPALFHRRNREGWLVTMRLEDWIELFQRGVLLSPDPFSCYDQRECKGETCSWWNAESGCCMVETCTRALK